MIHLEVIQAFIECATSRSRSDPALIQGFGRAMEALGFRYYACCSHVDPLHSPQPAIMVHNYPDGWVRYYSEAKLYLSDPVLQRAIHQPLPFYWDTVFRVGTLSTVQNRIMAEARSYGIAGGYTVPLHLSWLPGALRASCSVIPEHPGIDLRGYSTVLILATYLYAAICHPAGAPLAGEMPILTAREHECLTLAAQGKTDWEIGHILNLSESTAHTHLERAKERFGVGTRVQAVVNALYGGLLSWSGPKGAPPKAHRHSG